MNRRVGVVSSIVLSTLLLSGATTQSCNNSNTNNESIGPSKGEVIGVAVGVVAVIALGTVVLIEVHNAHHTIKGCVLGGPAGLQVEDMDNQKIYDVTGVTANVKVGDKVRLHGNKEKKVKGATTQTFVIEKLNKDYGPCKVSPAAAP
jgi:hypothetical protein